MRAASGFLLRAASVGDATAIVALPDLEPATQRLVRDELATMDRRRAIVASDADGAVVAFAMATRQDDAAHVLDVAVAHGWRRRGVATALLAALAAGAVEDGTPALTLEVRAGNAGARALYARLGFEDAGVRPGYYRDGEDAHVLWHHHPAALAAGRPVTD